MKEPVYLFQVLDAFDIQGRGCVVLPGIPGDRANECRKGRLLLRRPDGSELQAFFDLEFALISSKKDTREEPMCLLRGLSKAEVPSGTEVWFIGVREA